MSDAKLRELERRWRETGAGDDEAAYLLERVRVGDLTQERLRLAGLCSHPAALAALGRGQAITATSPRRLAEAASRQHGPAAALRAVVVLGGVLCESAGNNPQVRVALDLTRKALKTERANIEQLHAAWSDAVGMDVILRGPAAPPDVVELLLHRIERLTLEERAMADLRTKLSSWALDGTEP